jgi:integrase
MAQIGKPQYRTGQDALTPKEYNKILSVCRSIDEELLIKFAVSTALRRDDLINVEIANIKFEEDKEGIVTSTLTYTEHKKRIFKGGPSKIRTIQMGPSLTQLIIKYIGTLGKKKRPIYLFQFRSKTAYNMMQSLCERAGISNRPFHSLRATAVKRCQSAGWTPEQVSELTGDTIRVIQQYYATPSSDEMKEVAKLKEVI